MSQSDLFGRLDRDKALELLEANRGDYLAQARAVARRLALQIGTVTVNDVRAECPPPADVDPRVMGAIFNKRDWVAVGFVSSSRRTCHARPIRKFMLRI